MPAPLLIFHLVQAWMEVAELCNWKFEVTGKWMEQISDELPNFKFHMKQTFLKERQHQKQEP